MLIVSSTGATLLASNVCISRATLIQGPTDCLLTANQIFGGWIQCFSVPNACLLALVLAASGWVWRHASIVLLRLWIPTPEAFNSIHLINFSTFVGDNICRLNSPPSLLFFTGWPQVNSGRTSQKIWNRSDQGECVCTGVCLWATPCGCFTGCYYQPPSSATVV